MIHQFSPVQLLMTTSIAEITLRNSSSISSSNNNKTRSICYLHWLWVVVAWSWNPQTLHQPRRKVSAVITTTTANDPLPKAFKRKTQNKVHLRRQQLAKMISILIRFSRVLVVVSLQQTQNLPQLPRLRLLYRSNNSKKRWKPFRCSPRTILVVFCLHLCISKQKNLTAATRKGEGGLFDVCREWFW